MKGLDWIGAILSTCGLGLLVYDLGYDFLMVLVLDAMILTFTMKVNRRLLLAGGLPRSFRPF